MRSGELIALPPETVRLLDEADCTEARAMRARALLDPVAERSISEIVSYRAGDVPMTPIGLWGDGVPCNWDRTESVEVISMNLPGQDGQWGPLRIPLVAISNK